MSKFKYFNSKNSFTINAFSNSTKFKFSYICRKNIKNDYSRDAYYLCKADRKEFTESNHKYEILSPWHDISLYNENKLDLNFCVEIPFNESRKLEMSKELKHNPIIQDVKTNSIGVKYLRYIKLPYLINYGFLPQTWEDNTKPLIKDFKGDNDPIDILEISGSNCSIGDVIKVTPVASFCLIDQEEVDWKVLVVNKNYLNLSKISARDYLQEFTDSGKLSILMNKFKIYKTLEGKKANTILDDKVFNIEQTYEIIEGSNKDYTKNLSKLKSC
jgi:inorganic pyrophosphatase